MSTTVSRACVETPHAGRYLRQMCSHFAHKVPVLRDDDTGRIELPDGACVLAARGEALQVAIEAASEPAAARIEGVIARHLERFAWRERLVLGWRRDA